MKLIKFFSIIMAVSLFYSCASAPAPQQTDSVNENPETQEDEDSKNKFTKIPTMPVDEPESVSLEQERPHPKEKKEQNSDINPDQHFNGLAGTIRSGEEDDTLTEDNSSDDENSTENDDLPENESSDNEAADESSDVEISEDSEIAAENIDFEEAEEELSDEPEYELYIDENFPLDEIISLNAENELEADTDIEGIPPETENADEIELAQEESEALELAQEQQEEETDTPDENSVDVEPEPAVSVENVSEVVEITESAPETQSSDEVIVEISETPAAQESVQTADVVEEVAENEVLEKTEPKSFLPSPSRTVSLAVNQYLDVVYPGSGWIYLGEVENKEMIRYFGRKIGNSDTSFSLRTRGEGTTLLHFYKNDALTGEYIDDYLEVSVSGKTMDNQRVTAPSYAEIVPGKSVTSTSYLPKENYYEQKTEAVKKENKDVEEKKPVAMRTTEDAYPSHTEEIKDSAEIVDSAPDTGNTVQDNAQEKIDLESAYSLYKDKKYEEAVNCLNSYLKTATSDIDEALFLQGQIYEKNSPARDIKAALDAYGTIVRRYPQSQYWKKANERLTYLKKFYFNIR